MRKGFINNKRRIKGLFSKLSLFFILLLIFTLDIIFPRLFKPLKAKVFSGVSIIVYELSKPINGLISYYNDGVLYLSLKDKLNKLQQDNYKLQQQNNNYKNIEKDYISLKKLQNYNVTLSKKFMTARIIGNRSNVYSRVLIIDRGLIDGVYLNQPILSPLGLLGRVISVKDNNASILLLEDINSSVSVRVGKKENYAILDGDNSKILTLKYLKDFNVSIGDEVVTSGHGGIYPSGLFIGTVQKVSKNVVYVELSSKVDFINFVRLLSYKRYREEKK